MFIKSSQILPINTTPSVKIPMHHSLTYSKLLLNKTGFWDIFIYPLYKRGIWDLEGAITPRYERGIWDLKCKNPCMTSFAGLSVFDWGIYHVTCCCSEATCVMPQNLPWQVEYLRNLTWLCLMRFLKYPSCQGGLWVITHSWPLSYSMLTTNNSSFPGKFCWCSGWWHQRLIFCSGLVALLVNVGLS